ncbi:MAG: hypothetical protein V1810_04110 [Candidatus Beckwithbacteria bacterium]
MSLKQEGSQPTIQFSTNVVDNSKARKDTSSFPDSAPIVPHPIKKTRTIPLYSTPFGKSVLKTTSIAYGLIGEALTGIKHRFLAKSLAMNLHPDISVKDTEGLEVTITVPVTQFTGLDSSIQRVQEATDNFLKTGGYRRRPQLPPGKQKSKGERIIPTPSAPKPDSKKIQLDPVSLVQIRNKQLTRDTGGYWPIGNITFTAGDESSTLKILHDKRMADLPLETAGMLMPDLDLEFNLRYVSQTSALMETSLSYPLGQTSIKFDENGALREDPNQINEQVFHPALRSLKDFAELVSAKIFQATGKAATIDPKIIYQAMLMAPKADKDTEGIIGPYIDRMRYVGAVSRLLTSYPGEFALGLARIINIVDKDGNPHPQAAAISTGIMANILGFEDAPHPYGSPLTYIGLVSSLNQTLNDVDPDNPAYIEWAGNAKIINMAVNRTTKMPELYALVKKLGISNAEQVAGEYRKTMTAAEFFGLALTPQVIGLSALTLLRMEHSQANIIKHEFLRIMHVLDTVDEVALTATQMHQDYWDKMLTDFLAKARKYNFSKESQAAAQEILKAITAQSEQATQAVSAAAATNVGKTLDPEEESNFFPTTD